MRCAIWVMGSTSKLSKRGVAVGTNLDRCFLGSPLICENLNLTLQLSEGSFYLC